MKLPKDEQRSDWSLRPLRQRQLNYAAADVLYLIGLAELLGKELRAAKRMRWAKEEFEALTRREWPDRQFDELGYLRIKGARRLDPKGLSILRELYLMRDARARELDRPPFKVLGNRTLLEIAERKPRKLAELSEIKGITDLLLRRIGRDVMAAVRSGRKQDHGPIPKLPSSGRRRMDRQTPILGSGFLDLYGRMQPVAAARRDVDVQTPAYLTDSLVDGRLTRHAH